MRCVSLSEFCVLKLSTRLYVDLLRLRFLSTNLSIIYDQNVLLFFHVTMAQAYVRVCYDVYNRCISRERSASHPYTTRAISQWEFIINRHTGDVAETGEEEVYNRFVVFVTPRKFHHPHAALILAALSFISVKFFGLYH